MRAGDYRYFDTRFAALAHRGGYRSPADKPLENTVHAFARAVELGYRYLETDVWTSSDGVPIAFHDARLERTTDSTGRVADLPLRALQQVRVAGTESIPTLDELLERFPETRFNLDLKTTSAVKPVARTIAAHRAEQRVCVGSFSPARIRAFRRLTAGTVATAASPVGVVGQAYAPLLRRIVRSPGVALQIPERVGRERVPLLTRGLLRAAHAAGRVVHVWTVNQRADMERLIDLGVDGIVTDRIDLLAEVLAERGLWED